MSTTTSVHETRVNPSTAAYAGVRDGRTIRRWVVAACLVIAPVSVAVIRVLIPYSSSPSGALAASLANANLYPVLAVAEVIVAFTMGFAMLGLGRLIQGRTPLLALIGTPIAVLSWILGGGVLGTLDSVTYEMAQLTAAGPITATILDRINANPEIGIFFGVFISGHLLGTLLLGVGLLVSRRVPAWAGLAVIAGDVLHPIAFVLLQSHALDGLSYLVMAIGMAMAARAVVATPNDAWDLAPMSAART
jgi:hypothetical protein